MLVQQAPCSLNLAYRPFCRMWLLGLVGQGFLAGDSLILPKVNQVHLVVVTLHIGSHPLLPHKQCHSGGRIFSSDVLALLCSTTLGLNRKHSCFYLLAYYIVELNHHVFQWDPFGLWHCLFILWCLWSLSSSLKINRTERFTLCFICRKYESMHFLLGFYWSLDALW